MKQKLGLSVFCLSVLSGCGSGFSDEDIAKAKDEIRQHYAKQNQTAVEDVVLLRETKTKLTGFVKVKIAGGPTLNLPCSATMEESGKRYLWRCGLGA